MGLKNLLPGIFTELLGIRTSRSRHEGFNFHLRTLLIIVRIFFPSNNSPWNNFPVEEFSIRTIFFEQFSIRTIFVRRIVLNLLINKKSLHLVEPERRAVTN